MSTLPGASPDLTFGRLRGARSRRAAVPPTLGAQVLQEIDGRPHPYFVTQVPSIAVCR